MMTPKMIFDPDFGSPPGETLKEVLQAKCMDKFDLAIALRKQVHVIDELLNGKRAFTTDIALQLEELLGTPAKFWLVREERYREVLKRSLR